MGDLGLQLPNAPQQFKVQLWLRLIETMRIADGDRQGIHIDAIDKCLHLRDTDLCRTISDNPVLCPGNRSQFRLHADTYRVGSLDNQSSLLNIFPQRKRRPVEHDRGKPSPDAGNGLLKAGAVVQVQNNW